MVPHPPGLSTTLTITLTHICIQLTSESSRNFDLVMTPSGQTNMKLEYWDRMTDSARLVLVTRLDTWQSDM